MIKLSVDTYNVLSSKSMPLEDLTPGKYLYLYHTITTKSFRCLREILTDDISPELVVAYSRIYYEEDSLMVNPFGYCGWYVQIYPDGYSNPPYSPRNLDLFKGYNKTWCLVKCLL